VEAPLVNPYPVASPLVALPHSSTTEVRTRAGVERGWFQPPHGHEALTRSFIKIRRHADASNGDAARQKVPSASPDQTVSSAALGLL